MERRHLMIGLFAGIACFLAAVWLGFEVREMTIAASERLHAVRVDELARAMSSVHQTNQAVLWHYVLIIGLTVAGFLMSGIALIAWWGSRIVARDAVGDVLEGPPRIASFPHRSSSSMQVGGKRYFVR